MLLHLHIHHSVRDSQLGRIQMLGRLSQNEAGGSVQRWAHPSFRPSLPPSGASIIHHTHTLSVRHPSGCDETMRGSKGSGYRGCQTKTKSGRTCQKWSVQSPQSHKVQQDASKGIGDHNYCRNPVPSSTPTIWCYTNDPATRWEYCDPVPSPGRT